MIVWMMKTMRRIGTTMKKKSKIEFKSSKPPPTHSFYRKTNPFVVICFDDALFSPCRVNIFLLSRLNLIDSLYIIEKIDS